MGALRWDWINLDDRTMTLPDTFTKNKVEHTFPYGPATAAILENILRIESPYVFPASRDHVRGTPTTSFNGWATGKPAFEERCGVTGWTLHDIRRTFATRLAEMRSRRTSSSGY